MAYLLFFLRWLPRILVLLWRHCIVLPSVLAGMILVVWLVMGHSVGERLALLQYEEAAWRDAPTGYVMVKDCENALVEDLFGRAVLCPMKSIPLALKAASDFNDLNSLLFLIFILSNTFYAAGWALGWPGIFSGRSGKGYAISYEDSRTIRENGDE